MNHAFDSRRLVALRVLLSLGWLSAFFCVAFNPGQNGWCGEEPLITDDADQSAIGGIVLGTDRKPIENVAVYLLQGGKLAGETLTDGQGRYRFENLPDASYRVWAESSNATSRKDIRDGKHVKTAAKSKSVYTEDLFLEPTATFNILVTDAAGERPIANAEVTMTWSDIPRSYRTDDQGRVTIGGLPLFEWTFVAKAAEHAAGFHEVSKWSGDEVIDITLNLPAGAKLTGTVCDDLGSPIANAKVSVVDAVMRKSYGLGTSNCDASGNFLVDYLPRGTELLVSISDNVHLPFSKKIIIPSDASSHTENIELKTKPYGGDCIVHVVNQDGEPIENAKIENVGNSSADVRTVNTDSQGKARVSDIFKRFDGPTAIVRAKGYISYYCKLKIGSKESPGEVKVELEPGLAIRGRLVGEGDTPLTNVWVFYNHGESGFGGTGGRVDTDAQGRFKIDGLPEDSTFTFYTPERFAPINDMKLPVGTDEEIVVKAEPENVLRLRAIDATTQERIDQFKVQLTFPDIRKPGDPNVGVLASLYEPGTDVYANQTEFRLGHLANGRPFKAIVSAKGYNNVILKRIEASLESDSDVLDVELQPTSNDPKAESSLVAVAGTVSDTKGKPVANAIVHVLVGSGRAPHPLQIMPSEILSKQVERWPNFVQLLSTSTNRDGKFRLDKVKQGDWCRILHAGGGAANGQLTITTMSDNKELQSIAIEAELPGKIHIKVDRKEFPDAASIRLSASVGQSWIDDMSHSLDGTDTLILNNMPTGKYTLTLKGPPIRQNNQGIYRSETLQSVTTTVEADETSEVDFN